MDYVHTYHTYLYVHTGVHTGACQPQLVCHCLKSPQAIDLSTRFTKALEKMLRDDTSKRDCVAIRHFQPALPFSLPPNATCYRRPPPHFSEWCVPKPETLPHESDQETGINSWERDFFQLPNKVYCGHLSLSGPNSGPPCAVLDVLQTLSVVGGGLVPEHNCPSLVFTVSGSV